MCLVALAIAKPCSAKQVPTAGRSKENPSLAEEAYLILVSRLSKPSTHNEVASTAG
jgi:hypothetical protein